MVTSRRKRAATCGRSARVFAWLAAGAVLLFAVSGHPAFINFRVIGLILLIRGAVGLWMSIGRERLADCKDRLVTAIARGTRAVDMLTADLARDKGTRLPLSDLLKPAGQPGSGLTGMAQHERTVDR